MHPPLRPLRSKDFLELTEVLERNLHEAPGSNSERRPASVGKESQYLRERKCPILRSQETLNKNVSTHPSQELVLCHQHTRNSPNATLKLIIVIPVGRWKTQEKDLVVMEEIQHLTGRNERY